MGETLAAIETEPKTETTPEPPKEKPVLSPLVQGAGYWQHDHLPPGSNRSVRAIYSALPDLVLANAVVVSDQGTLVAIDPTKDLVVHADVVRIFEALKLPGRNVTIVARTLIFHEGASIDTSNASGVGPVPSAFGKIPKPDRAKEGWVDSSKGSHLDAEPGVAGGKKSGTQASDGGAGDAGLDAGGIDIAVEAIEGVGSLIANGGEGHAGQNAQDGQDGGDGGHGAIGGIGLEGAPPVIIIAKPGAGGVGGEAGRGGPGGNGGDAGVIRVRSVKPMPSTVTLKADAGKAGDDGANGHGGTGGFTGKKAKNSSYSGQPMELELLGPPGQVNDGAVVGFKTFEKIVGTENTLGTFRGQYDAYYYTEGYDSHRQGWVIRRVDRSVTGPLRYGERVVITNESYGTRLTVTTDDFLWCTSSTEEWCLFRPSDSGARDVIAFGDRVFLRVAGSDHPVAEVQGGARWWYPTVANVVAEQAANGVVRAKPPGKDPWAEKHAGKPHPTTHESLSLAELAKEWHPTQAFLEVERLNAACLTHELVGKSDKLFFDSLQQWQKFLALCSTDDFGALQARLTRMLGNVVRDLDAFGHQRDYAPNLSRAHYDEALTKKLKSLAELEASRKLLIAAAARGESLQQHAAAAFNEAKGILAAVKDRLLEARGELANAAERFRELDRLTADLQKPLAKGQPHIDAFIADVKSAFNGCDLENVFEGLSMMAFAPPASHEPTGEGPAKWEASASGMVMAGTQLASYLQHSATTLKDDRGVVFEKGAVLSDLQALGEDTFASARQVWTDNRGRLHDTSMTGILATLDKWDALVTRFLSLPSATDLVHDIRALADATRERGEAVVAYNFALSTVLELLALSTEAEGQMTESLKTIADGNSPDLPMQLAFLARQYQEQRDAAVELVHLFNRAYAYWRLDDWTPHPTKHGEVETRNVFRDVMDPGKTSAYAVVDCSVLQACKNKLDDWFETDLEKSSALPQDFPDADDLNGYQVFIPDGAITADFRTPRLYGGRHVHYTKFVISPDGTPGTFSSAHLNRLYDVRLLKFRVFLLGAHREVRNDESGVPISDAWIHVEFVHDSREQNVTEKGARRSFSRPALESRSFVYDGSRAAEVARKKNPNLIPKGYISTDGDIGYRTQRASKEPLYAGVSPFCQWTVIVDPSEHEGLVFDDKLGFEIQLLTSARTRH